MFFFQRSSSRVAKTASGIRWVRINEVDAKQDGAETGNAEKVEVRETPAWLHGEQKRFSALKTDGSGWIVRQWQAKGATVGFTLKPGEKR